MHLPAGLWPVGFWPAFVTLFVTIGPIDGAAIFSTLTSEMTRQQRARIALRCVVIAGIMFLVFALAGNALLMLLNVSLPAFQVAGGVLLFLQALSLMFASPGMSSIKENEELEAAKRRDIAVFPLAFPLFAGPGSFSATVLLMSRADTWIERGSIIVILFACLVITYVAMRLSDPLMRLLGRTGSDVVGRISGVLLAALAVQFVFDGLRSSGLFG
jgi:multiple antibiotic resistance protein